MRKYPDFIKAFLEYTEYVEAPETFLLWSAISAISGALERKVWIDFKGQSHCYPNLYVFLVGPPGLVKKSVSASFSMSLLHSVEDLKFLGTRLTSASLIEDLRASGAYRNVEMDGEKYNNSSVFLYSSEAAVTFKDVNGPVIQLLTDFWDCQPNGWYTQEEGVCWKQSLKGEGESRIYNPCVGMLACSTPAWLVESIGKENLESGFAARILFVVHNKRTERSFSWADNYPSRNFMKPDLIADLTEIAQLKGQFNISMCFKHAYDKWNEENNLILERNQGQTLSGYYARKHWQLLKLCQILAASRGDSLTVTSLHLEAAKALLKNIEPEMEKAFEDVGQPEELGHLIEIFDVLRASPQDLSSAQIMARFLNKDQKTVMEAIQRLTTMQRLKVIAGGGKIVYKVLDQSPLK